MTFARIRALTTQKSSLEAIAKGIVADVVSAMDLQLDQCVKTMRTEPPPKPDSKYIRTHMYATGWTRTDIRQIHEGLVGSVLQEHDIRYTEFVGGDESGRGQQSQHKVTGWPLLAEALRTGYAARIKGAVRG